MTLQDFEVGTPGYHQNSNYPVEYGGVRRQKHARSPGLNIQPDETLGVTSRQFPAGRWVIATFDVDGRVFTYGCSTPGQPEPSFGWVEEIEQFIEIKACRVLPTGQGKGEQRIQFIVCHQQGIIVQHDGRGAIAYAGKDAFSRLVDRGYRQLLCDLTFLWCRIVSRIAPAGRQQHGRRHDRDGNGRSCKHVRLR